MTLTRPRRPAFAKSVEALHHANESANLGNVSPAVLRLGFMTHDIGSSRLGADLHRWFYHYLHDLSGSLVEMIHNTQEMADYIDYRAAIRRSTFPRMLNPSTLPDTTIPRRLPFSHNALD